MKHVLFLLTIPFLLLSFSNCGGAKTNNKQKTFVGNPPFKIANAHYQKWVAGVQGGGSGINVFITLSDVDKDVVVQDIYFRKHILEAKNSIQKPNEYIGYLINKNNRNVVMDRDPVKEAQNTPSKPFPFQLADNEAVISYWFGGKKNYYKISNLAEKELIPYPKANPNSHE
jgi:hypothetical protein